MIFFLLYDYALCNGSSSLSTIGDLAHLDCLLDDYALCKGSSSLSTISDFAHLDFPVCSFMCPMDAASIGHIKLLVTTFVPLGVSATVYLVNNLLPKMTVS